MRFLNVLLLSMIGSMAVAVPGYAAPEVRPNVVIIYGDDVGFGDVGIYGSKLIPTPNIDKMASEGLVFTDGHCSAATCTPSRFSLLTGVHGFRHGVRILPPNAPLLIPTDVLTLPKLFKRAGYQTGVIGKWHLGLGAKEVPTDWNGEVKPGSLEVGFDFSFLLPSTNDRVPCVYLLGHRVLNLDPADPLYVGPRKYVKKTGSTQYPDGKTNPEAMTYYKGTQGHNCSVINGIGRIGYMSGGKAALWNDETMTDVFVEQVRKYIATHKDEPFFLYYAAQNIHAPRTPNPRFQGATKLGYRGDSMVEFDWATGEVMKALTENGLDENTIVIFSSDNGPVYNDGYDDGTSVYLSSGEEDRGHDGSGIHRGGKYQIYEGGTRVPFIIRWPGKIKPATSGAMVNQIDLMASLADLLDIPLKKEEASDSRNTLKAFLGQDPQGHDFMIEESWGPALRVGDWKYVEPQNGWGSQIKSKELYNLAEDPSETTNIIDKHPERAESMANQLEQLIEADGLRK